MLLEALIRRQRETGMSDYRFAAFLGIPTSTWRMTRIGVKPLRTKVLRAAYRAYPDLAALAAALLIHGEEVST